MIPCIRILKDTRSALSLKYSSRFITALNMSLYRWLGCYEESDVFWIASALDPRFKLKCTGNEATTLKSKLIDKIRQANPAQVTPEPNATLSSAGVVSADNVATTTSCPKKSVTFFDCLLKDSRTSVSSSSVDIESALEKYLSQPCLKQEEDPLDFWKSHCQEADEFACIARFVPKYLCIFCII